MVHDDDTGKRADFTISGAERRTDAGRPARLPSPEIQDEIRRLGKQGGVGTWRIFALFRRKYPGIKPETIEYILQQDEARKKRGPRHVD